ncbi:hypothetical protein MBLNU230_g0980t1 [Neophaeotheca triangularis]
MPPTSFRKRDRSPTPDDPPSPNKKAKTKSSSSSSAKPTAAAGKKPKPTLFDAVDTPLGKARSKAENKALLDRLGGGKGGEDEDEGEDSELSDLGSDQFEDVEPAGKKRRLALDTEADDDDDDDESDDEDMQFEDAMGAEPSETAPPREQQEIADVNITLNDDGSAYTAPLVSAATGKKGPSKKERATRVLTHCLHVQSLMWHNAVRNSWLNDGEVQRVLVEGLSVGVKDEVKRWRESMGVLSERELEGRKEERVKKKGGRKGKGKGRDWGADAKFQEAGVPDLSRGDPLLRLLKILTAYWKKRFTVTAPGLRKQGYMPLKRLRDEIRGWQGHKDDQEEYGERIESKEQFRKAARQCEGSRDVGAQLFVALLRGLGVETRLVANLQPIGIGWSKGEDADVRKTKKEKKSEVVNLESEEDEEVKGATPEKGGSRRTSKGVEKSSGKKANGKIKEEKPSRKSGRGNKSQPINLEESDSELSELSDSDNANGEDEEDDASVVDVTPATKSMKPNKKYDRDMAFPNYWAEVLSPVSNTYIPVDPVVLNTIASNAELLLTFEPRGKKAEKAKQVICYTIAHASDGTAKDVTVRYLKKHQLPGKTKGLRVGPERIPIYNRKGKIRKYEEYDWFKTVMSGYTRPSNKRSAADDLEEQTELKPFKPADEKKEVEKESLQWYKQSADYVLEHHLRREEAILPSAKPVRSFTAGKGDKAKTHPVYKRSDVVVCKTVESWHKEGRALKPAQQPMKYVPMRAVTLVRKREMEDAKRETGEALKQGLYSREQTDWIIPPPIVDGKIPKNAFGNMDVYVPTMVPEGAVHLPLKGSAKLCRKLDIDYAEACTGFEFGKQRAVPVLTGVVVAEEHEELVRDAWRTEQKEVRRKEDEKRRGLSLHWWRKMLMGLRIVERMREEYSELGDGGGESNPFVKKAEREGRKVGVEGSGVDEEEGGGGFFLPGHDEEEVPQTRKGRGEGNGGEEGAGGFLPDAEDEDTEMVGGGFLVEENPDDSNTSGPTAAKKSHATVTPVSLQSRHKAATAEDEADENEHDDEEGADVDDNEDDEEDLEPEPSLPVKKPRRSAASSANKPKPEPKPKPKPMPTPTRKTTTSRRKPTKAPSPTPTSSTAPSISAENGTDDDRDPSPASSALSTHESEAPTPSPGSTPGGVRSRRTVNTAAVSPKVVVSPAKRRRRQQQQQQQQRSTRSSVVGAGKDTQRGKGRGIRSRFFAGGAGGDEDDEDGDGDDDENENENDDNDNGGGGEGEDSGDESEEEVVKPRRSTARTRARATG